MVTEVTVLNSKQLAKKQTTTTQNNTISLKELFPTSDNIQGNLRGIAVDST